MNNDGYDDIVTSGTTDTNMRSRNLLTEREALLWQAQLLQVKTAQLAFGDYDRDGNIDLYARVAATVTLLQGNGAGSFGFYQRLFDSTGGLAVGDLDGDGVSDFVVTDTAADVSSVYLAFTRFVGGF